MKYREMQAEGIVEGNQEENNNEEDQEDHEGNNNEEDQEENNEEEHRNPVFDLNLSLEQEQPHGDGDVEGDREVQEAKDLLYEGAMAVLKVLFRIEMSSHHRRT